ncbi:MAG: hypothetical protein ACPGTS_02040, partial [Minisyncoccia bacterium]
AWANAKDFYRFQCQYAKHSCISIHPWHTQDAAFKAACQWNGKDKLTDLFISQISQVPEQYDLEAELYRCDFTQASIRRPVDFDDSAGCRPSHMLLSIMTPPLNRSNNNNNDMNINRNININHPDNTNFSQGAAHSTANNNNNHNHGGNNNSGNHPGENHSPQMNLGSFTTAPPSPNFSTYQSVANMSQPASNHLNGNRPEVDLTAVSDVSDHKTESQEYAQAFSAAHGLPPPRQAPISHPMASMPNPASAKGVHPSIPNSAVTSLTGPHFAPPSMTNPSNHYAQSVANVSAYRPNVHADDWLFDTPRKEVRRKLSVHPDDTIPPPTKRHWVPATKADAPRRWKHLKKYCRISLWPKETTVYWTCKERVRAKGQLYSPKIPYFRFVLQERCGVKWNHFAGRPLVEKTLERLWNVPNYCKPFQTRDGCPLPEKMCDDYHYCEFCAHYEHGGDNCPWRPYRLPYRTPRQSRFSRY